LVYFDGKDKCAELAGKQKAPGTTPGLKPNPLEPTHPFPMTWEGITILKPST